MEVNWNIMFSLVGSNYSRKNKNMVQHFKSKKMTLRKWKYNFNNIISQLKLFSLWGFIKKNLKNYT